MYVSTLLFGSAPKCNGLYSTLAPCYTAPPSFMEIGASVISEILLTNREKEKQTTPEILAEVKLAKFCQKVDHVTN